MQPLSFYLHFYPANRYKTIVEIPSDEVCPLTNLKIAELVDERFGRGYEHLLAYVEKKNRSVQVMDAHAFSTQLLKGVQSIDRVSYFLMKTREGNYQFINSFNPHKVPVEIADDFLFCQNLSHALSHERSSCLSQVAVILYYESRDLHEEADRWRQRLMSLITHHYGQEFAEELQPLMTDCRLNSSLLECKLASQNPLSSSGFDGVEFLNSRLDAVSLTEENNSCERSLFIFQYSLDLLIELAHAKDDERGLFLLKNLSYLTKNVEVIGVIGNVFRTIGQKRRNTPLVVDGISLTKKALTALPNCVEFLLSLGRDLTHKISPYDSKLGIELLTKAHQLDPENGEIKLYLGGAWIFFEGFDPACTARNWMLELMRQESFRPLASLYLSEFYLSFGQGQAQVEQAREILSEIYGESDNPLWHYLLGKSLWHPFNQRDWIGAIQCLKRAMELCPASDKIKKCYQEIYLSSY